MSSRPLPLVPLARFCRNLATLLDSGVSVTKALGVASKKAADPRFERAVAEALTDVKRGKDVTAALAARGRAFPRLTLDLVKVAEQTGTLPETLRALADHYENLVRLRKGFLSQIAYPMFQLALAVLIIGGVIWLLGVLGDGAGFDITGLGLVGTRGAVIWFGSVAAIACGLAGVYWLTKRTLTGARVFDPVLLQVPVLGGALRKFALARFSWAFALTQNAGMDVKGSLHAALTATGNGAYANAYDEAWTRVAAGEELTGALRATDLFPADYLEMFEVAEASGSVPETLDRIGPDLEADARRAVSALAAALGWVVWAVVAGFIVWIIFSDRVAVRGDDLGRGERRLQPVRQVIDGGEPEARASEDERSESVDSGDSDGRRTPGACASGSREPFSFTLTATDGRARAGVWSTPHGDVPTPAFMPVGTAGTVKGVLPDQLRAAGSTQILANTYHLALRPGAGVVAVLGGLHRLMAWDGPILTDSGGFQVFSLADLATMNEEGVRFVSHVDGAKLSLTPESSVEVQAKLGADVMMCLDECPPLPSTPEKLRAAVDRTTRWARRCRDRWDELGRVTAGGDPQALFGIVQGGTDPAERARSAEGLVPLDFPGYAVGGLSVGEAPAEMYATLDATTPHLPEDKPRYLMGVGTPADLVNAVLRGWTCSIASCRPATGGTGRSLRRTAS